MDTLEESDNFDDTQPEEEYYDAWDDPDWEPPCRCWCELCGCHGWCDEDDEDEEDEDYDE